jgi:hypothetical protein
MNVNMNPSLTLHRFTMHFSIICTAIPALGRLIVELQPEVNAFAITEQHGVRNADKYALSSFGHRFPQQYLIDNRLGGHATIGRNYNQDSESLQGLREDGLEQNNNAIKRTVGFEVRYLPEDQSGISE